MDWWAGGRKALVLYWMNWLRGRRVVWHALTAVWSLNAGCHALHTHAERVDRDRCGLTTSCTATATVMLHQLALQTASMRGVPDSGKHWS